MKKNHLFLLPSLFAALAFSACNHQPTPDNTEAPLPSLRLSAYPSGDTIDLSTLTSNDSVAVATGSDARVLDFTLSYGDWEVATATPRLNDDIIDLFNNKEVDNARVNVVANALTAAGDTVQLSGTWLAQPSE